MKSGRSAPVRDGILTMERARSPSLLSNLEYHGSVNQGLPKGGHYSRSTTALVLWTLRVDTRSKGGVGCVSCGLGKG